MGGSRTAFYDATASAPVFTCIFGNWRRNVNKYSRILVSKVQTQPFTPRGDPFDSRAAHMKSAR